MRNYYLLGCLALVIVLVAACGGAPAQPAGSADGPAKVMVMDAWARPSTMAAGNGAVYMQLMNEGDSPDKLTKAESEVAKAVEIHQSKMEGDVMKMAPVSEIEIPAGQTVKLEPGGYHIMLIELGQDLVPGEKLTLTLNFAESGSKTVEAEIRAMGDDMEMGDHKMEGMEKKDSE